MSSLESVLALIAARSAEDAASNETLTASLQHRYVIVTDGIATYDERQTLELGYILSNRSAAAAAPVYALVLGTKVDLKALTFIATMSGNGRVVRVS